VANRGAVRRECFGRSRYVSCPSTVRRTPIEPSSTREDDCFGKIRYDNAEYRGRGRGAVSERSIPGEYFGRHRCDAPFNSGNDERLHSPPFENTRTLRATPISQSGQRRTTLAAGAMRTGPKPIELTTLSVNRRQQATATALFNGKRHIPHDAVASCGTGVVDLWAWKS
jgi:hypothetical protein